MNIELPTIQPNQKNIVLSFPLSNEFPNEHFLFTECTANGEDEDHVVETESNRIHNWLVSSLAGEIIQELQNLLDEWTGTNAQLWSCIPDRIWAMVGPFEISGEFVFFAESGIDAEQALMTLCNRVYRFCLPNFPSDHDFLPSASTETAYWQSKAF